MLTSGRPTVQIKVSNTPAGLPSLPTPIDPASLTLVTNLCSALQHSAHPDIGFYLDATDQLRGTYRVNQQPDYAQQAVSLADLLNASAERLSLEDQYYLGITLTSSLLQLSHTSWLSQSWSKNDIIFLRVKNQSNLRVDVKHPYLSYEHTPATTSTVRINSGNKSDCSKLLGLATMLTEIVSKQPIENLRQPADMGPGNTPNEFTNVQAIRRWVDQEQNNGNLSHAFSSAISYCLKSFVDPSASLQRPDFRRTVEEQVLAPLELEMQSLLHGPNAY